MVGAEIDGLHVTALPQVPEVEPMTIFVRQKIFGNDPVLELWRQSPFARHHVIARQVPPEIIVELLRAAIDLPTPEHLECLAVHDENAGRALRAVLSSTAQGAHVNALRAAMDRMRSRVTGLPEHLFRLDDP